jgi:hypothetical protein
MRWSALPLSLALLLAVACSDDVAGRGRDAAASIPDAGMDAPPDASRGVSAKDACAACSDSGMDARVVRDAHPGQADSGGPGARDSGADASTGEASFADGAPIDAHQGPADYPDGPYGTKVGDTLPFFRWEGYVVATADAGLASDGPVGTYSSDDMRRSGRDVALLHVADFDCPGCNHAADVLAKGAKAFVDAGGLVIEVLGSQGFFSPADRAHLDAWVETYGFVTTSVIDAPGHELATRDAMEIRETALVVDLATMRVLFRMTGDLAGIEPSSLCGAFPEMHRRLARCAEACDEAESPCRH